VLIEAVSPKVVQAPAAVDATTARIFSAPDLELNMPDWLQQTPMTILQPALTTPEP
jgi:hypothetical protein